MCRLIVALFKSGHHRQVILWKSILARRAVTHRAASARGTDASGPSAKACKACSADARHHMCAAASVSQPGLGAATKRRTSRFAAESAHSAGCQRSNSSAGCAHYKRALMHVSFCARIARPCTHMSVQFWKAVFKVHYRYCMALTVQVFAEALNILRKLAT